MTRARQVACLLAGGAVTLTATGCGVDTGKDGAPAKASTTAITSSAGSASSGGTGTASPAGRRRTLPRRPSGTLAVDAQSRVGITAFAATSFGGARVALATTSEDRAYADLCAGRADVIETSNVPTDANRAACSANGLEIADAIQTASDAIVLATKNETDVGGDCITVKQARDIFRAGSPYQNWSELGFDSLGLRTTGRADGSDNFQFFGFQVLGLNDASLADVRPDYRAHTRDRTEREEVINFGRIAAANRRIRLQASQLRSGSQQARQAFINAAVKQADKVVQLQIRRINAQNKRLRVNVNGPRLIRDNRLMVERAKRDARVLANARFEALLQRKVNAYRRGQLRTADAPGVVGPFRFSYYELYEEQLRPLEIDFGLPETESGQPTRFSDLTPGEQRRVAPLLRRVLTRDAGVSAVPPSSSSQAVPADTTLAGLTTAQLPNKDRFGKAIFNLPNCVFPARTTITSGAYPLARRTFAVTTKTALQRPEVISFLKYYLENAQTFAENDSLQLVPITNQQQVDGLKVVGITNPRLPVDPVAPVGTTTQTNESTRTTTVGGRPTTTTDTTTTTTTGTTSTGTGTTTTPNSSTGIPGVSTREP